MDDEMQGIQMPGMNPDPQQMPGRGGMPGGGGNMPMCPCCGQPWNPAAQMGGPPGMPQGHQMPPSGMPAGADQALLAALMQQQGGAGGGMPPMPMG